MGGGFGDHHLYKGQFGDPVAASAITDVRVESVAFTFFTDLLDTDTDSDTVPDGNTAGVGIELTFWDREDIFDVDCAVCSPCAGAPPGSLLRRGIVTIEASGLPGTLVPGVLSGVIVALDLGAASAFEIGDSDGVGPASGLFNPLIAADQLQGDPYFAAPGSDGFSDADTDHNGTVDWSYSIRGIQPTDGRTATIAYQLAGPGVPGVPNLGDATDGVIDYTSRTDVPPQVWDYTRVHRDSVVAPMGVAFPFVSDVIPGIPTYLSRFSLFRESLEQQPDPLGPQSTISFCDCIGGPDSDFYAWSAVYPPTGQDYGGLNCAIDDDGDTVPEGRPLSLAYLVLSGAQTAAPPCDADLDGALTLDDIDAFIAGFVAQTPRGDCNADGAWTLDDIDCFVGCFLGGA